MFTEILDRTSVCTFHFTLCLRRQLMRVYLYDKLTLFLAAV